VADNYETQPGAGGVIFRSHEDGSLVHWPAVKLSYGTDAEFIEITDADNFRLPVKVGNFPAGFNVNNFPAGFLAAQSGAWTVAVNNFPGSQAVTGPLTDAELRAVAVPVSGTFFQATQPVSGPLTDAQLRATPVPVSGTVDLGATDNAVLDAIAASLALLDNAIPAGAELQVDVVAALPAGDNNIGNVDIVTLPALVAGSANIGDVDVLTVPVDPFGVNADAASATGSISAKLRFIAATGIPITALPASTNTLEVVGDAAHDAAIAGNPVRVASRAMSADYTAVATGETADQLSTLLGKQVIVPYALPAASETYASPSAVTDTADDEAFAAGAAGVRHYITGVQVFNGHDTVGTEVVIKDGSTVKWRGWAEQTGGGCSARFDPPLRGTAATAVNVANITTGSSTYFNLQGYQAAE